MYLGRQDTFFFWCVLQSRSIRVQGGHLCFQIGPTGKKNKTKQKCVTGLLHFVVLASFHGQRIITKIVSLNPSDPILAREKRQIERRNYFIRENAILFWICEVIDYFIVPLNLCYRFNTCTSMY